MVVGGFKKQLNDSELAAEFKVEPALVKLDNFPENMEVGAGRVLGGVEMRPPVKPMLEEKVIELATVFALVAASVCVGLNEKRGADGDADTQVEFCVASEVTALNGDMFAEGMANTLFDLSSSTFSTPNKDLGKVEAFDTRGMREADTPMVAPKEETTAAPFESVE